jgi:membrane-bound lytic murein transglycosylase MltF
VPIKTLPVLILALALGACSRKPEAPAPHAADAPAPAAAAVPASATNDATDDGPPAYEADLPPDLQSMVFHPFTGDFDEMLSRRIIRAALPFNRTYYFIDKGVQRGLAYEYLKAFEDELNKKIGSGNLKVHVVMIPMRRDQLVPALRDGKVDLVVAQFTVTPERQKIVDFSNPTRRNVNEVVVTAPGEPALSTADDLSGRRVYVRKTSSYYDSLMALNAKLKQQGKPPVDVELASESLEDDDLLEMVNADLIPITVVDDYFADYWKQVFTNMTVHSAITLRTGGDLAVAIRKQSPKLAAAANEFIAKFGLNSAIGNTLNRRYLQSTKYAKNAQSAAERQKYLSMVTLFRKYGEQYQFDYLMMAAQAYQESGLDQNARSSVGAIGVMQLMPATGKEQAVGDIQKMEPNIHAGVKYMRFMRDQYFADEPMTNVNKALFTFASYNAGPGKIRQLRRETERRGLDPDVWFGNVEQIVSERIGRETVTYVSNIYKYYLAYKLLSEETARRNAARSALGAGK